MYPVYVYEEGVQLPAEGEYYVVAGNGNWFRKDTGVLTGYIPVPSIPFLPDLDLTKAPIKCTLPKIPHELVMKVKKFFVQVFKKFRSEACVILYRNTDHYTIFVPQQWNSHDSVSYIRPNHKEEYGLSVGTIHSHCDFGAFHSPVDRNDESSFDGLHITFGDITDPSWMSITASIVVTNIRCTVDPLSYLEGVVSKLDSDSKYKILPPEGEVDYDAWAAEVNFWIGKVNDGDPPHPWTEETIIAWKEQNGYQEN